MKLCIAVARVLWTPNAGGHAWEYLNWALGIQANGFEVTWLDSLPPDIYPAEALNRVRSLHTQMQSAGLRARISLVMPDDICRWLEPVNEELSSYTIPWPVVAAESDILLNFRYSLPEHVVRSFKTSVLLDNDPALLQVWLSEGQLQIARHDKYFTIGETVGEPDAFFPDCGIRWHHTYSPVDLTEWPVAPMAGNAPFTTVTNWGGEWVTYKGYSFSNEKRTTYLGYFDLPRRVSVPVSLAICFSRRSAVDREDENQLERNGWQVQHAWDVTPNPMDYRSYIQRSRGEFSCAKPSCMYFANAWISNRTACYLASGKPAIVQHTGGSKFLPDAEGLFRFRTMDEAVAAFAAVSSDYEHHSRAARALAEEYFNAKNVAYRLLGDALP